MVNKFPLTLMLMFKTSRVERIIHITHLPFTYQYQSLEHNEFKHVRRCGYQRSIDQTKHSDMVQLALNHRRSVWAWFVSLTLKTSVSDPLSLINKCNHCYTSNYILYIYIPTGSQHHYNKIEQSTRAVGPISIFTNSHLYIIYYYNKAYL